MIGAMSAPKRLLILGSTGSIGTQAIDVCSRSDELEIVGLSAGAVATKVHRIKAILVTHFRDEGGGHV